MAFDLKLSKYLGQVHIQTRIQIGRSLKIATVICKVVCTWPIVWARVKNRWSIFGFD